MTWFLIIICGIITFLMRFLPLSGIIKFKSDQNYYKIVNVIPIVVLSPIIFESVLFVSKVEASLISYPKLFSAIVATIVCLYSKSIIYTILIGMSVYLLLNYVFKNFVFL